MKVDFQGSRVTSDGGLILVRELDERLSLEKLIEEHGLQRESGYCRRRESKMEIPACFCSTIATLSGTKGRVDHSIEL